MRYLQIWIQRVGAEAMELDTRPDVAIIGGAAGRECEEEGSTSLDSLTLTRLIEEVRNSPVEPTAYNRTHNRHNRT